VVNVACLVYVLRGAFATLARSTYWCPKRSEADAAGGSPISDA